MEDVIFDNDYSSCWYCDNILDHDDQVGLLYLGFPRCFVLIPNKMDFYFSTFESFKRGVTQINWLDPADKGTEEEREAVLIKLWNFSILQEKEEDRRYEERMGEDDDF